MKAMVCAAVTQVLAHFTNPTVGGNNAKTTFEAGMTAARDGTDLGTNAIKWLAVTTAGGWAPLTGTAYHMSRMLGGIQFAHTFSGASSVQAEGCTTYPSQLCNVTPEQGLENVLQVSYFVGTPAGPLFGASPNVNLGNFRYSFAPMNFLEIYDDDVLYASGLSNCAMADITGNPASPGSPAVAPDLNTCEALPPSALYQSAWKTQEELDLTGLSLLFIAEPALF